MAARKLNAAHNGSDATALLRAIGAEPDEDTPRLVYADLIEEHGDSARAGLIRGQCELERLDWRDPRHRELSVRVDALLKKCGKRWRAELPRVPGIEWCGEPTRGFFEGITVTDAGALRDSGELIRSVSPVTRVRVESPATLAEVAGLPFMADVEDLIAELSAGRGGAIALAGSAHARQLRYLDLNLCGVGSNGLVALLTSPALPALRDLSLRYASIDDDTLRLSHVRPKLRSIDLAYSSIGDVGLEALLRHPRMKGLESLQLEGARVGDGTAVTVAAAGHLRNLKFLGLEMTAVTDSGVWALGRARHLRGLTRLYLPARVSAVAADKLRRSLPNTLIEVCRSEPQ